MKSALRCVTQPTPVLLSLILAGLGTTTAWTAERYVSLTGGHVTPFTDWASAATNIQAAIDAANDGDVVWVTNGVYNTGGKLTPPQPPPSPNLPPVTSMLTNRITVDKAITVQSVNGAEATIIQGYSSLNILLSVRCAWLTNGATLRGFTLRGGATLSSGLDFESSGGGVFCTSSNDTFVLDCIITDNDAFRFGGGAYSGFLKRCVLSQNRIKFAPNAVQGAAHGAVLVNCLITDNQCGGISLSRATNCAIVRNTSLATSAQAAVVNSILHQCTVTRNCIGGMTGGIAVNSIIWDNWHSFSGNFPILQNHPGQPPVLSYCCTYPILPGVGNTDADPQLLEDGIHLAATSSCRGAGDPTQVIGTDLDGQPWANLPAIGCDEWLPEPLVGKPYPRPSPHTGQVRLSAVAAGETPFTAMWTKDGLVLTNGTKYAAADSPDLLINAFDPTDAGAYQVVISNTVGSSTSAVTQVTVHCVDAAGTTPQSPYLNWSTAATNIQEAIDAAQAGDIVLVTNGLYNTGGRIVAGPERYRHRMVLDRPLLVTSVNGPEVTHISGYGGASSPAATRCAWVAADPAGLSGFTLREGETMQSIVGGGGVFCEAVFAELANCIITNCSAGRAGGGIVGGRLDNCILVGNTSTREGGGAYASQLRNCVIKANQSGWDGGGVYDSQLHNCLIKGNSSGRSGGGAKASELFNCTVVNNSTTNSGGGIANSKAVNSIIYFNQAEANNNDTNDNVYASEVSYSCAAPLPDGAGNITGDPQFVDGFHLAATSPCRGAGLASAASGLDLDGDPWSNPPSMGCDEVVEAAFVGPLTVTLTIPHPQVAAAIPQLLTGEINGRAARIEWAFGDGVIATNLSYQTGYAWATPGTYTVTLTAYNADHPSGVSAQATVEVQPWLSPQLGVGAWRNGQYTLSFTSQFGLTYVVEQTTNLTPPITWQLQQTVPGTGGLIQLTNSSAAGPMRFYRVHTE
ncbi:MAG: right-handed parallel beta-helix repeat-containing protein [Verrucomicrobiae bacterium]|nr:right-handed parallel beta-helix repeat-containing protein [Verrucomicrobiae bacterium]